MIQPSTISNARQPAGGATPATALHKALMKQAEKWVGTTFYGQMLKQMRNSPFKSDLFGGGRGGQAFSAMYDQELAGRMAHGVGGKLVRGMVRRLEHAKQRRPHGTTDVRA